LAKMGRTNLVLSVANGRFALSREPLFPRLRDFLDDLWKRLSNGPSRVVRFHFAQITVITDVIAVPWLIYVSIFLAPPGDSFGQLEGLKYGAGILFASTQVVDFGTSRIEVELIHEVRYILGMNVVADLLPFIPVNFVFPSFDVAFDEVTQEAV
jgi:hypothetical protein